MEGRALRREVDDARGSGNSADGLFGAEGPIESGCDDGHADLAVHCRIIAGAEDDLGIIAHRVVNDVVDLGRLAQGEVVAPDDVDEDAHGAGDGNVVEQRTRDRLLGRLEGAIFPRPIPVPISAAPPFCITVRTSAKSTLMMPVEVIRLAMPWVAWSRTSSAFLSASWNGMPFPTTASNRSLGTMIMVSTFLRISPMPPSACFIRRRLRRETAW